MLRLLVLMLLLLNVSYFAWRHGWLAEQGLGPSSQHEPQRLARQISPEAVRVLDADAAASPEATASSLAADPAAAEPGAAASAQAPGSQAGAPDTAASQSTTTPSSGTAAPAPQNAAALATGTPATAALPTACWQWTNLEAGQVDTLRPLLAGQLPAEAWVLDEVLRPGRWLIYMGKYANTAELTKKREQLSALKIPFETLRDPTLTPGLSLGVFSSEQGANKGLQELAQRGVRTARVLPLRPPSVRYTLRLPALTTAQQPVLARLNAALPDQPASACTAPSAPAP